MKKFAYIIPAVILSPASVLAAETGTANQAVVNAMTTVSNDMIATANSIVPVALSVVGISLVVVFGVRLFRRIAR